MFRAVLIFAFAVMIFAAGCDRPATNTSSTTTNTQHTNLQTFQVKGIVIEVKPQEKAVVIRHQEVTNYMPAMTMPFDVKDTNELNGIEAGDPVSFRLLVTDTEGWIDQIRKTGPKTNV